MAMAAARLSDWKQSSFSWIDMDELSDEDGDVEGSIQFGAKLGAKQESRWCCCGQGTCFERLLYLVERNMSRYGWLIQCLLLVLVGAFVMTVGGLLYSFVWEFDEERDPRSEDEVSPFFESVWEAWTFMADGGTHATKHLAEQRVVGASISIAGIVYLGVVLAVIVDMVRERIDNMKRGRSKVYERNHTLVVNWTDKTIPVIAELCIANASEGGGVVVVLSSEPMESMELDLALQLPPSMRYGTQIICRSGSPVIVGDLFKVSADRAKAVVILAHSGGADEADSSTLRCVLSLKSLGLPLNGHIVAELRDIDNEPLLKLVGGKVVEALVSHDVLGRLMIMAVRQPGLAKVYEAVLGFEGSEFYIREWPELVGVPFGELQERFPRAVPFGVCRADGHLLLNPDPRREIEDGDQLIVIAEDDDTYRPEPPAVVQVGAPPVLTPTGATVEKVLVCGWRRDIRDILVLLDSVMQEGSEVHMMTHCVPIDKRTAQLLEEGLDVSLMQNIRLVHHGGNTSVRKRLEVLPIECYTSCMIFADQAYEEDTMHSDSHSLSTLLLIRDIESSRVRGKTLSPAEHPTPIICEVLDSRTQRTISGHKNLSLSSDFVQSNKLVAQIMAMVAEQRSVKVILDELLGIGGSSLLVVPPHWYVVAGEEVSFLTVAKRAALNNAILIGYQLRGSTAKTILNPPKKHEPMLWDPYDLAVIAGNRTFDRVTAQLDSLLTLGVRASEPRVGGVSAVEVKRRIVGSTRRLDSPTATPRDEEDKGPAARAGGEHLKLALKDCIRETSREGLSREPSGQGLGPGRGSGAPDNEANGFQVPSEAFTSLPGAMMGFRRLCASLPDVERRRLGEALVMLGHAAVDGSMFTEVADESIGSRAARSSPVGRAGVTGYRGPAIAAPAAG